MADLPDFLPRAIEMADAFLQDRWNEGAAACMGLIGMANAIRMRSLVHKLEPLNENDVTDADRAIVNDFYEIACHAEWCEFDSYMLEYLAARSRLNGARGPSVGASAAAPNIVCVKCSRIWPGGLCAPCVNELVRCTDSAQEPR